MSDNSPACGDGILWYVDKYSAAAQTLTTIAYGSYPNGGSQTFPDGTGGAELNSLAVIDSDVLYLVIHPNGDYYCDDGRVPSGLRSFSPS